MQQIMLQVEMVVQVEVAEVVLVLMRQDLEILLQQVHHKDLMVV